jgi:TetR/AcrR family transcriptional repressor of bet genes
MSIAVAKPASKRRTASKETRQLQLIKATIRSIAKHGLSATTMATVSKEAKLSQGIINLHFQSKDRLLVETLRYVADEYKNIWDKALSESGPSNAEKIAALVRVDFEKSVCQRNKLAVWFAFWGETKSRPTYREICRNRDQKYLQVMIDYCDALVKEGNYKNLNAESIANALLAMTEGLWLDLLMSPDYMSPEQACEVCMHYLQTVFPEHFKP